MLSVIMVYVGIICNSTSFSKLTSVIVEYTDDPDVWFVFSDQHAIIARYLNGIHYRKCLVYHLGNDPKHKIGNFRGKGGFVSYAEIEAAIREDTHVLIT